MRRHTQLYFVILWSLLQLTCIYAPDRIPNDQPTSRTFPVSPYWTDYMIHNKQYLRWIGQAVDWLHFTTDQECPEGTLLSYSSPVLYSKSINYLSDAMTKAQVRFKEAYERMIQPTPEGKAKLARFGFNTTEAADKMFDFMTQTRQEMADTVERYMEYSFLIDNMPGLRHPPGHTAVRNLFDLSLRLNSGEWNSEAETITLQPDGRVKFLAEWRAMFREISADVKWAKYLEAYTFKHMNTPAATELLEGWKDPGSSIGENHAIYEPFSYPVLWYRARKWFQCWQYPTFDFIDYAANILNPIPEPGPPVWVQKTQKDVA
ncbi:hypothetical protein TWF694_006818 [Orbilia ellipsospora]|uniref:Uncharacterized protein n=1 Tax=Orbilia ellipsospora TaxID=2528407 RepID=A0AAV9XNW7_9PEZI